MANLYDVNVKEVTVKEFADFIIALESEIPNLLTMVIKGKFGVIQKKVAKTYCEEQEENYLKERNKKAMELNGYKEVNGEFIKKTCSLCSRYAISCSGSLGASGCKDWESNE